MKSPMRRCLLRRIACTSAQRYVEKLLPDDKAVAGTVFDLGDEQFQVADVEVVEIERDDEEPIIHLRISA